jgi:hypothetical protein
MRGTPSARAARPRPPSPRTPGTFFRLAVYVLVGVQTVNIKVPTAQTKTHEGGVHGEGQTAVWCARGGADCRTA